MELVGLPNPEGDAEMIAMTVEGLRALGLRSSRSTWARPDSSAASSRISARTGRRRASCAPPWRARTSPRWSAGGDLGAPAAVTELLLALPTLYGRGDVLDRAEALVKNARSEAALTNLAEVYRLLRLYGLADSVLLDLGEVRGFDYYSGVHFEAYVSGLGASLVGGGRYDQMLATSATTAPPPASPSRSAGRCSRPGVAGTGPALVPGPDFFIIDFTPDKTRALALARRYRDLGAAVARDIIIRGLADSLAYARQQRVRWVLAIGGPETSAGPKRVRSIELEKGGERILEVAELLADPERHFPGTKEQGSCLTS